MGGHEGGVPVKYVQQKQWLHGGSQSIPSGTRAWPRLVSRPDTKRVRYTAIAYGVKRAIRGE